MGGHAADGGKGGGHAAHEPSAGAASRHPAGGGALRGVRAGVVVFGVLVVVALLPASSAVRTFDLGNCNATHPYRAPPSPSKPAPF